MTWALGLYCWWRWPRAFGWLGVLIVLALLLWHLLSRRCLNFRFTCLSRLFLAHWWRVIFAVLGLAFASLSMAGEILSGYGAAHGRFDLLQRGAEVWPLDRDLREAPAHAVMIYRVPPAFAIAVLNKALRDNPYSSDELLALMFNAVSINRMDIAESALARLQKILPPHVLDPELRRLFVFKQ